MADFGDIKAQIKRDLVRDNELSSDSNVDLDDDTIEHYVKAAINYYKIKPYYFNEASTTLTTVTSQRTIGTSEGFPSDFIAPIELIHDTENNIVSWVDFTFILNQEQSVVTNVAPSPEYYAIFNNEIRLYPTPDSIFTLTFYYTKELSTLSGDSSTNAWTNDGERLIRARAMGDIYAFRLHDTARASAMYQIASDEVDQLMSRDQGRSAAGQLLVPPML